jgi:hypothetical protein
MCHCIGIDKQMEIHLEAREQTQVQYGWSSARNR